MADDFLRVENLTKSFGATTVVRGVDFAFGRGEFISLLGPSGCGKTTILRMIAGFERPSGGRVLIGGEDVTHLPPNRRQLGMVFQAYALFPNLNVGDNIGFGLKVAGVPAGQRRERVAEMLGLIGLPGLEKRYPYELSGGQQQRVALARAIAPRPKMLLLDEPLSALDAQIRVSLREEIRAIQRELGITTVFVTHDQEEALSISDRVVVMNSGRIDQLGTPLDVYNRPRTRFVATFVGTLNTLAAKVVDPASGTLSIDGQTVSMGKLPGTVRAGDTLSLALRPEAVSLLPSSHRQTVLEGTVADVSFLGAVIRLSASLGEHMLRLDSFNDQRTPPPERGDRIRLYLDPADLLILDP